MTNEPAFAATGDTTDNIEVRLSNRIVELFSEGLYTSPNKAVEELVANPFDAGARRVHVLLSSNLHDQDATIAVFDDGEGMDREGLKRVPPIRSCFPRRGLRTAAEQSRAALGLASYVRPSRRPYRVHRMS